jgi:hypothetical protein
LYCLISLDFSMRIDNDLSKRHKNGTLADLLQIVELNDGKVLNGLDFPRPNAPPPPQSIASDLIAWDATLDLPWCKRAESYPSSSVRWGLAGTAGAHHFWHIDCDGFGTYIDVQVGKKWWVVAKPKDGESFDAFASINTFLGAYDLEEPGLDRWTLEGILLGPGDRL